jgi:MFS family permease
MRTFSLVAACPFSGPRWWQGWAAASDKLGRKNTYYMFAMGIPMAASVPFLTQSFSADPNTATLYAFYFGTMAMISFYGGLFSVLPAYLADVFGSKHVGAIHGRTLTAWSAAAVLGPNFLGYMRNVSETNAVKDLAASIEPAAFHQAFSAPVSDLSALLKAKTVTIPRLLELAPPGTPDPSPLLYNTTMYGIAGMLSIAAAANFMIKPVDPKHHLIEEQSVYDLDGDGVITEDEVKEVERRRREGTFEK